METKRKTPDGVSQEVKRLRQRLEEAEDTLRAVGTGQVDAVVVSDPEGERIFTLKGEEYPYRVFIETMNEGAVTLLADGTIAYGNNRFAEIVNAPLEKMIGEPFEAFVTPRHRDRAKRLVARALAGRCRGELQLLAGSEEAVWAQLSLSPLALEGVTSVCVVAGDISKQKGLESQLREQNRELAEQNRQLEAASRMKSDFLANMSHELRSPLNGIIGFSELLYDGKTGPLSGRQKDFIGRIDASAKHLLHLINGLLDLSKVEAGHMDCQPQWVVVPEVIGKVIGILEILAVAKHIRIQTEIDARLEAVYTDPERLEQVLYNYLSNALKFTGEGGRIVVRSKPEGATEFRLEVADTGIGIPENDLGRLFIEFQQLDTTRAKRYQGAGLGLALTRHIVKAQGGRVGVESTPGEGSTFFAVLPSTPLRAPAGVPLRPLKVTG